MSATEPTATPQQGRDSHGRFTKGNAGGPGNPHARQVAALRQRLLDKVTAEEMDAILDALLLRAREGDVAAAKLILQYSLGRPLAARDPDRLDADEVDAFHANALSQRAADLVKLHPMELMLPIFRILLGARAHGDMEQFAEAFTKKNGPDGMGKPPRKKQSAPAAPPALAAEEVAPPQAAAPNPAAVTKPDKPGQPPTAPPRKPAAVTKRKPTEPVLPATPLPDWLLTALLATDAALTIPPADTKREQTAGRVPNGLPPQPPLPHEADRQQTAGNGEPGGQPSAAGTLVAL